MSDAASSQVRPEPLTGAARIMAGVVPGLCNFTAVLDMTIANVSVPHIASGLAVSPSHLDDLPDRDDPRLARPPAATEGGRRRRALIHSHIPAGATA